MDASTECGEARGDSKGTFVKPIFFSKYVRSSQNLEPTILGKFKISRYKYRAGVGNIFIN